MTDLAIRRSRRKPAQKNWSRLGYLNDFESEAVLVKAEAKDPMVIAKSASVRLSPVKSRPLKTSAIKSKPNQEIPQSSKSTQNSRTGISYVKAGPFVPFSKKKTRFEEKASASSERKPIQKANPFRVPFKSLKEKRDFANGTGHSACNRKETDNTNVRVLMVSIDCQICSAPIADRHAMAKHLATAHKKPPYKCLAIGCDEWFDREGALGSHVRVEHANFDGQWPCGQCHGLYRSHNLLYKHIWDLHATGQFRCAFPKCNFGPVTTRNVIRQHYVREHDAQRYKCRYCHKPFNAMSGLRHHERTHTGVKPFLCAWPKCGHSAIVKCSLITHIRSRHFKVARTLKRQLEQHGELDNRDPNDWVMILDTRDFEEPIVPNDPIEGTCVESSDENPDENSDENELEEMDQESTKNNQEANDDNEELEDDEKMYQEADQFMPQKGNLANDTEEFDDPIDYEDNYLDEVNVETVQYTDENSLNPYLPAVYPENANYYLTPDQPLAEINQTDQLYNSLEYDSQVEDSPEDARIDLEELVPAKVLVNGNNEVIYISSDDEEH